MLYFLHSLEGYEQLFNVFRYVTFRAAMGAVFAFLFSVLVGKSIILFLRSKNIKENAGKKDSAALAEMHASKSATPTMGGIIILSGFVLSALLWARLNVITVWVVIFGTVSMGMLGAYDDWMKLTIEKSSGMSAKMKMTFLFLIGTILCLTLMIFQKAEHGDFVRASIDWFYYGLDKNHLTVLQFPFEKTWVFDLGWFYIPFFVVVLVGSSNAVNLTDGLDGLAAGCMIFVSLTYLILAYLCGHREFADYLNVIHIVDGGEMTVLCGIIVGSCLGFLWYNSFPAQVFMGDTGSLALGGFIGMISLITKHEIILILAGGIFVAEALSVMIQVGVYKRTKKRVFKCAPLHHHFQFLGMPETKIVARFWIVGIILALVALATIKVR